MTHLQDDRGAAEIAAHLALVVERLRTAGAPESALESLAPLTDDALPKRAAGPVPRIGDIMVGRGLITTEQLNEALEIQRETKRRLGEVLIELGAITRLELAQALADHLGVPFADLQARPPDRVAAALISGEVARRYRALPLELWNGQLIVAMADPKDVFALDDLRVLTGHSIVPAIADIDELDESIEQLYGRTDIETSIDDALQHDDENAVDELDMDEILTGESPVVRLAQGLLEQAVVDRASDLHIEPSTEGVAIRMRVDGILHDVLQAPLATLRPLVSRLKVMGGLDIAQSRLPQDGRFSMHLQSRKIDVRIASIPTVTGEALVLRLLDPMRTAVSITTIGLSERDTERLLPAVQAAQGAIFVTGPTGSGKSSTVYAIAQLINTRERSIISVEDPVEFHVSGLKQIQINTRAGFTFPTALRSVLRADPDIIMIGEVRDAETAGIAADASITGHLVLSTLHSTSAASTPVRLIDMGVEPYLVASAMSCVVAQRLVRVLCENCAQPIEPDRELLARVGAPESLLEGELHPRAAIGCRSCLGTGYRGRAAVFEIMTINEEIGQLIVARASAAEIERAAVAHGMDTLRIAALRRVAAGKITLEEMLRVVV